MAYETGTASGYIDFLTKINTFVTAHGWTNLYSGTDFGCVTNIWRAPGLLGGEEIYVGASTYGNVAGDYYNLNVFGLSGFYSGNFWKNQPGFKGFSVQLWNHDIPYWAVVNGQRLAVVAKVGATFQSFYLGKIVVSGGDGLFPYALFVSGMQQLDRPFRYSDYAAVGGNSFYKSYCGYKGYQLDLTNSNVKIYSPGSLRLNSGEWIYPHIWPKFYDRQINYSRNSPDGVAVRSTTRPAITNSSAISSHFTLEPLVLYDSTDVRLFSQIISYFGVHSYNNVGNIYGELDGIYSVSGFGNASENIIVSGGKNYLVFQDGINCGVQDFFAMRLD